VNSSEITRETSFQFESFHRVYHQFYPTLPSIDNQWLEWFIGFTEGDGSIFYNNKPYGKELRFVITQKEKEILEEIRKTFGFGVVRHFSSGNYYRYIVSDNKHNFILRHLFNGNLAIHYRIQQLNK